MLKRLASAAAVAMMIFATPAWAGVPGTVQAEFDQAIAKAKSAMMGDPQAALGLSSKALTLARAAAGDPTLRVATAEWLQGEALIRVGRPKDALPVIEQALAIASALQPNSKLHGDLIVAHAGAVSMLGQTETALSDYQRAFDIYRSAGERRGQAIALQNIGSIYQDAGDYQRVLQYYAQSAETYKEDPILLITAVNNKANAYTQLKEYGRAIPEFKAAIGIARQMRSPALEASILSNLAAAEVKAGRPAAAEADVDRGLQLAAAAAPDQRPFLWGVAAQAALARGAPEQASRFLAETFQGVDPKTSTLDYRDFHETAYKTYAQLGDYQQAFVHLQAFKRLDDDARGVAASANAALMTAHFDFANQNLKIAKLKAGELQRDVELARQRNTITMGMLGGSGLMLVLLTISFLSIRRSRDQVRATNVKLTSANGALEKALKAKSDFLAATSHEIRTPLNGILGMTQILLADRSLDVRLKEKIELVHGSGETMRALVDDILDLAKMQTGKLSIEKTVVDLPGILEGTGKLWSEKARARGLQMSTDIDPGLRRIVEDGGRLRQVVFNLLSNATKFTHEGEVRLTARAERHGAAEQLVIEVSDTGIGIPLGRQSDIFEAFTQVDASTTRKYGGTGLGLAISRDLVEAMGGWISVTSEPGKGAAFTVVLPLQRAAEPASETPSQPVSTCGGAVSLADCRLLVVEANPLAQSVLRASLSARVRELEVVGCAEDAMDILRLQRFDWVLADAAALAPGPDDRLASLSRLAEAAHAPVSVLWPSPDEAQAARLRAAGAADVLTKPITPLELLAALQRGYPTPTPAGFDASMAESAA